MTITSPDAIYDLLTQNGWADPEDRNRATSIWSYYNNTAKKDSFAVFMDDDEELFESAYVSDPVLLWNKYNGLTAEGKEWIQGYLDDFRSRAKF